MPRGVKSFKYGNLERDTNREREREERKRVRGEKKR
jgi:hypothetical protein